MLALSVKRLPIYLLERSNNINEQNSAHDLWGCCHCRLSLWWKSIYSMPYLKLVIQTIWISINLYNLLSIDQYLYIDYLFRCNVTNSVFRFILLTSAADVYSGFTAFCSVQVFFYDKEIIWQCWALNNWRQRWGRVKESWGVYIKWVIGNPSKLHTITLDTCWDHGFNFFFLNHVIHFICIIKKCKSCLLCL